MDNIKRNPNAPVQKVDVYEEKNVIDSSLALGLNFKIQLPCHAQSNEKTQFTAETKSYLTCHQAICVNEPLLIAMPACNIVIHSSKV